MNGIKPGISIGTKNTHQFDPSCTLFLGDLSYFCAENNIASLFAPYGPIVAINLCRGKTGESLLYAFIELTSELTCKRAMIELDGMVFMGRNLR